MGVMSFFIWEIFNSEANVVETRVLMEHIVVLEPFMIMLETNSWFPQWI